MTHLQHLALAILILLAILSYIWKRKADSNGFIFDEGSGILAIALYGIALGVCFSAGIVGTFQSTLILAVALFTYLDWKNPQSSSTKIGLAITATIAILAHAIGSII